MLGGGGGVGRYDAGCGRSENGEEKMGMENKEVEKTRDGREGRKEDQ